MKQKKLIPKEVLYKRSDFEYIFKMFVGRYHRNLTEKRLGMVFIPLFVALFPLPTLIRLIVGMLVIITGKPKPKRKVYKVIMKERLPWLIGFLPYLLIFIFVYSAPNNSDALEGFLKFHAIVSAGLTVLVALVYTQIKR